MNSKNKLASMLTFISVSLSLALSAVPSHAQTAPSSGLALESDDGIDSIAIPFDAEPAMPAFADGDASPIPAGAAATDSGWHFSASPYLWFPGVHGTAAGPGGRSLAFRASAADLLSHFRFGLMGAVEARHKRIVVPIDMMWIRLADDRALPAPALAAITANMKASEFILTPKIGYRVIDKPAFQADVLSGIRYWHLGETLNFNPSLLGLNFSGSQNFVDPLVGGRIQLALSPKVVVNVLGDVGGWGAGSQLEYQVGGFLGYRIKPAVTLQAGYRYLNVDYRTNGGVIFKATMSGVIFGATFTLK
jgi:hypothetical protein